MPKPFTTSSTTGMQERDQDRRRIAQDLLDLLAHQPAQAQQAWGHGACTRAMKASSSVGSGRASRAHARAQRGGRIDGGEPSLVDDAEPVAVFRFVHEVAGDQDGHAGVRQRADARPELAARQRIDAGGGFVEEQDVRSVQQRGGERQPLLQAERQIRRRRWRRSASGRSRSSAASIARVCAARPRP